MQKAIMLFACLIFSGLMAMERKEALKLHADNLLLLKVTQQELDETKENIKAIKEGRNLDPSKELPHLIERKDVNKKLIKWIKQNLEDLERIIIPEEKAPPSKRRRLK
jgi:hypothetical protein